MDQIKETAVVFNNQTRFSEKLHKRALQAIKDISEFYDQFEIKDDHDKTFIFNQLNHYYMELTHIIFNLQQILIDSGSPNTTTADNLKKILAKLNVIASSIQESLQGDPKQLKVKLKDVIVKVACQFETLTKIIALDNSHECKQRMLDCQLDFVLSTEKLELCNQFRNLTFAEIVKYAYGLNNDCRNTCNQIKTGYENMEGDLSHYVRINMLHIYCIVSHVSQLRNSGYFKGNLNGVFKQFEQVGLKYVGGIENALEFDNPIQKLLVFFDNCHDLIAMGASELEKGFEEIGQQNFDIKDLIYYIFGHGLNGLRSFNRTIKDAIIKN